ncbi:rnf10 [Scenedesmus sp. PABB004]|nr:rnf10 [Scenedesmus sp. PABB004]
MSASPTPARTDAPPAAEGATVKQEQHGAGLRAEAAAFRPGGSVTVPQAPQQQPQHQQQAPGRGRGPHQPGSSRGRGRDGGRGGLSRALHDGGRGREHHVRGGGPQPHQQQRQQWVPRQQQAPHRGGRGGAPAPGGRAGGAAARGAPQQPQQPQHGAVPSGGAAAAGGQLSQGPGRGAGAAEQAGGRGRTIVANHLLNFQYEGGRGGRGGAPGSGGGGGAPARRRFPAPRPQRYDKQKFLQVAPPTSARSALQPGRRPARARRRRLPPRQRPLTAAPPRRARRLPAHAAAGQANFRFLVSGAPRTGAAGSCAGCVRRARARGRPTRAPAPRRRAARAAGCADTRGHEGDADRAFDWDDVILVDMMTPAPLACPISLDAPPACPQITPCGHVFAFGAIMQHLLTAGGRAAPCPLCYQPVVARELRLVQVRQVAPPKVGDEVTFQLLRRPRESTIPVPVLASGGGDAAAAAGAPCAGASPGPGPGGRPRRAGRRRARAGPRARRRARRGRGRGELRGAGLFAAADALAHRARRFAEATVAQLQQRGLAPPGREAPQGPTGLPPPAPPPGGWPAWLPGDAAAAGKEAEQLVRDAFTLAMDGGAAALAAAAQAAAAREAFPALSPPPPPAPARAPAPASPAPAARAAGPAAAAAPEPEASGAELAFDLAFSEDPEDDDGGVPDLDAADDAAAGASDGEPGAPAAGGASPAAPAPSSASAAAAQARRAAAAGAGAGAGASGGSAALLGSSPCTAQMNSASQWQAADYYSYQAADGRWLFLHPLNLRCLLHARGGYDACPPTVTGRLLELEPVTQDEASRRRWKFLGHLPLHGAFALGEVALTSPALSAAELAPFEEELAARERRRRRRADAARRESRREAAAAAAAERARQGPSAAELRAMPRLGSAEPGGGAGGGRRTPSWRRPGSRSPLSSSTRRSRRRRRWTARAPRSARRRRAAGAWGAGGGGSSAAARLSGGAGAGGAPAAPPGRGAWGAAAAAPPQGAGEASTSGAPAAAAGAGAAASSGGGTWLVLGKDGPGGGGERGEGGAAGGSAKKGRKGTVLLSGGTMSAAPAGKRRAGPTTGARQAAAAAAAGEAPAGAEAAPSSVWRDLPEPLVLHVLSFLSPSLQAWAAKLVCKVARKRFRGATVISADCPELPLAAVQEAWRALQDDGWEQQRRLTEARAACGDVAGLAWLRRAGCVMDMHSGVCWTAARHGQVAVLEWARRQGLDLCDVCTGAAGGGQLAALRWGRAQTPPVPWDGGWVCSERMAADRGREAVAAWIRTQPW